ncbi:hypothetical protein KM427_10835 [Nocardioides sp. LMS-CY]|uniref:hypothetical protein n=1 Tax=Nocardioides sp. (strain LMS-CY) TaxID=2840457 RepID=UPI001C008566|nr:hypothetical protein [Nocardioides sp. LMS-CY]QWF24135.1 hypothetical protein KM427_10835 [Nocardioides sp. LMS-CY]
MRFRKLLVATAAVVAAGAMALAPAAQAAPTSVDVGGDSSNTSHVLNGVLKNASVNMQTVFGNIKLNCSSGSAAGTVNGGAIGNPVFEFTSLNLNCDSFIPGTTVSMQVTGCNVTADLTGGVSGGISTGTAHFSDSTGKACVKVTVSSGCTLYIGGHVGVTFDNTVKAGGGQDFVLNGSGATVFSNPAAPSGCLGTVSTGNALTLNSVTFNLSSPDGAITVS